MGNIEKFDAMADMYDTDDRAESARIIADAIREVVLGSRVKADELIAIDFGCGTGLVGLHLLDLFGTIIYTDGSEKMIDQVKAKVESLVSDKHSMSINAKVNLLSCDIMSPDLKHAEESLCILKHFKANYVIMAQVLLHEKDYKLLLEKMYDVLVPDGQLVIVDFDKNVSVVSDEVHNGFEQQDLTLVLRSLGFGRISSKTFYHGEKNFMRQDASMFILSARKPY